MNTDIYIYITNFHVLLAAKRRKCTCLNCCKILRIYIYIYIQRERERRGKKHARDLSKEIPKNVDYVLP